MPVLGWYQREVLRENALKLPKLAALFVVGGAASYGVTALYDYYRAPTPASLNILLGNQQSSWVQYPTAPGIRFKSKFEFQGTLVEAKTTEFEKNGQFIREIIGRLREGTKDSYVEVALIIRQTSSTKFSSQITPGKNYKVTGAPFLSGGIEGTWISPMEEK